MMHKVVSDLVGAINLNLAIINRKNHVLPSFDG